MNLKQLLIPAAIVAMFASATAMAAAPDAGAKFRGDYSGRWQSGTVARSRPMYRSPAPVVIRSEAVPSAVTQAPAERRSFSAEPSQPAAPQAQAVQPAPRVYRSYSYEPSYETYRAPARGRSRSQTPAYLLPKSDPRKFTNGR